MKKLRIKIGAAWRWMRCLVRILSGDNLRKMRELENVMKHWHKEGTVALERANEAIACGNMERAEMWANRCREARLRCEKDFRRPMIELTGNPDLFDANATAQATQEGAN